jgi:hypothetical protein
MVGALIAAAQRNVESESGIKPEARRQRELDVVLQVEKVFAQCVNDCGLLVEDYPLWHAMRTRCGFRSLVGIVVHFDHVSP